MLLLRQTFIKDSRRLILPAGIAENIILNRRQKDAVYL
jgi:hypothetical protein